VILENGRSVWTGRPTDIDGTIKDRYLGI
jgi:hypothetical protein